MMWTDTNTSDKMVFTQMFKSFLIRALYVEHPDENVFDENGYLKNTVYLAWYGNLEDGKEICRTIETFGYKVEWEFDRGRKIGVKPITDEELALRK